jgi:hypothetical protein
MDMFILFPHDIVLSHNHGYDESAQMGLTLSLGFGLDLPICFYVGFGNRN